MVLCTFSTFLYAQVDEVTFCAGTVEKADVPGDTTVDTIGNGTKSASAKKRGKKAGRKEEKEGGLVADVNGSTDTKEEVNGSKGPIDDEKGSKGASTKKKTKAKTGKKEDVVAVEKATPSPYALNPKYQPLDPTLNSRTKTLEPKHQTLDPKPVTL